MAVFKCKMCGGTLEISNNDTVAICEYCGTQQTLPKLDADEKTLLYERANHFRRNNEYDIAMTIYEQIRNADPSDAEAYWSLVLCRYGIEYVEEAVTRKRVPTVNRAQFTSIFDDVDYKSALERADSLQREIYINEAKTINEIQKGILVISQNEKPFDIFICYKESDISGRRTMDSVLAQDLYQQLTDDGYKVFFSRVTLEDKLGIAYEPYIFAALNSAKVMLVVGTKPEYFNAPWVKNEWSRYLALIKTDPKKVLIPVYRDMDAYDLPREFLHLQAQDMSKLGFAQDILRGINKIIPKKDLQAGDSTEGANNDGRMSELYLTNAFVSLKNGDFSGAESYVNKVLEQDPANPQAYVASLMIDLGIREAAEFSKQTTPFDENPNYIKILQYGDKNLTVTFKDYLETAKKREKVKQRTRKRVIISAISLACIVLVSSLVFVMATYIIPESRYQNAITLMGSGEYTEALTEFESLNGYKDSLNKADACKNIVREQQYNNAIALMDAGKYTEAISVFEALDGYKKSESLIEECDENRRYNDAVALMHEGKYDEAIAAFEKIKNYSNSSEQINQCKYMIAKTLMDEKKYNEAIPLFEELKSFSDSETNLKECKYQNAVAFMDAGQLDAAHGIFSTLVSYKDSDEKVLEIRDGRLKDALKNIEVGGTIKFGSYNSSSAYAPDSDSYIEWLVLDVKGNKALVISKDTVAIRAFCYPGTVGSNFWENSQLRSWLNETFIKSAFSTKEKALILTTKVSADKNQKYDSNQGNATKDQIFLLSSMEAKKYFSSDNARSCSHDWWLRTAGHQSQVTTYVSSDGSITESGKYMTKDCGVRPAMWIDLSGLS